MSEEKTWFESGAASSDNLPPYECLTETFLRRSAERMRLGLHYGKHNWKKGTQDKKFIQDRLNHAFVHLIRAQAAIDSGNLTDDDNLAAVVVNCMFAMEYEANQAQAKPPKLDRDPDLPPFDPQKLQEAKSLGISRRPHTDR